MDLKEDHILGSRIGEHWYYRSKAAAVRRLLKESDFKHILDVGAGSGFFSKDLLLRTDAEEGTCIDTSYGRDWSESVDGQPVHFLRVTDAIQADLVLLMDVLEHVDDDLALLKEYVEKVPAGAQFLITVPAFSFLWSGHDVFLEHKRRYRLREVEKVANQAGLVVIRGCYFFGTVFPMAAVLRILNRISGGADAASSDLKQHSWIINSILHTACRLELPLMPFNRAFGLSAFCLARKPSAT